MHPPLALPDRQDSLPALGASRARFPEDRSLVRAVPFFHMRSIMRKFRAPARNMGGRTVMMAGELEGLRSEKEMSAREPSSPVELTDFGH